MSARKTRLKKKPVEGELSVEKKADEEEPEDKQEELKRTGEEVKTPEKEKEKTATAEEQARKARKEKEEEEEIVEERIYTVPLGRAWIAPRQKHSPKAVRLLRGFITRHMKVGQDSVKITNEVNERIWSRGIEKPPREVRIRATKDTEGIVTVRLAEGD